MATKREEVLAEIERLDLIARKRKMALMLYDTDVDKSGFDISLDRVIVLTRTKLHNVAKPSDKEMMEEVMRLVKGEMPDSPKMLQKDAMAEALQKELEEIEGVRNVKLAKYEAHIEKAVMFTWEEVLTPVLDVLETFSLKKLADREGVEGIR